ncbi:MULTISPECIES: VaFE repeat-containing surface-anchored protein [unclassified Corynebacterium]|uniref:VaFE repeat-containing surface-anchored protein n=1 Tax=unclassified Corynebacterium TaxID=2624378 RepID=UPI00254F49DA|nr:VaFE repeat-containing surface-anchored protein [Corynebacterium kefirresidentii]MDK8836357.1 VaFE repeat-containing surface-anchored protein [Corynebacterium kefirresidentii]
MSKLRNISREGWMVFTAVLAAIAVIAAMVTVPGSKAEAAEPTDFTPNEEMGGRVNVGTDAQAWGSLTWAGPPKDGTQANPNNDVGWAWCIDPLDKYPNNKTSVLYSKDNATKLSIPSEYRDAVIRLALEWQKAIEAGDKAAAGTYVVYMTALVSERPDNRTAAAYTINGQNPKYMNPYGLVNFPTFNGSMEEFTDLTGLEIESAYNPGTNENGGGPSFKKVSEIPEQPEDYFVTVVLPVDKSGNRAPGMQRVMPPDQPGLPDDEGETEEPTTSPETPKTEENPSDETTPENPGEETTPNSETTSDSEPSNTEETTPEDSTTEPTSPEETTKVTEPTAPVPGTEEQEKNLEPKIGTEASFEGDKQQVVAGTTVKDKVHYEDLVPGKKYTLKAELRNKAADENGEHAILGTGSETFEAKGESGDVEVEIDVDKQLEKPVAAAVAFEKLYSHEVDESGKDAPNDSGDGNFIAEHEDINDEAQTVNTKWNPEIHTEAKIKDGDRVEKGATVIDTVTYKDLVPGKKYTLKAKLISKADGETVLGEGSEELVPEESAGKKDVEITVNDKADPAVDAAVAFEKLVSTEVDKDGNETTGSTDENVIATHEDINDEKQTVNTKWAPSIKTNADFDNAKQVKAGVTVKDTVTYTDLVPGKEYTLKAELRNKAENAEGEHEVVGKGEVTFTPKKSAGEQVVDIKVNDDVEGVIKAAVAFEDLYSKQVDENGKETPNSDEEKKITEHRDIDDEDQTVTSKQTPKISTNADFEDGSHEVVAGAKIVDEVSYEGLVPGKEYTLKAELISKADGETVLGKGEATFTPEKSEGKEPVTITVNDDVTEPVEAAVAFEELTSTAVDEFGEETLDASSDNPNEIAEHKDIDDEDQTVTSEDEPETSAPETTTSKEEVPGTPGDGDETCESEEPGNSESEKPSESEEPSSSESSEPSESESVKTTSSEASETSESDEPSDCGSTTPEKPGEPSESTEPNEPGTPGDNDEKDTPKVSTNADFEGGLREVVAGAKVVDQVSYEGLVPGKEYTLDAQLISKEDGKTVLGETKGHKFTPDEANGTEAVTIVVDEKVTEPVEAAVAFETLTSTQVDKHGEDKPADEDNPNPVGEHKDINDDDQTVTSEGSEKTPKITTNADFEKGSHAVIAGAKIVDEVTYEGLVPGKEYTLKAELINKKDGKSVLGTGEKTFTPEKSHGMVPVTITVNDDVKEPVQAAVAFEELTSIEVNDKGEETPGTTPEKPNHIAEHKDIDDDDQTVISHEVEDQDNPDDDTSNGGSSNGSSKDNKWWLILIPGIGLGKIIKDHFDHKDHGNHNGGHGDNTSSHNGGHGDNTGNHDGGNGHEVKGQDAPKGGNADNGHGRGVEVQGQEPEETGNALPSNAERVEIKSVPSGATELEPGMQDYIK